MPALNPEQASAITGSPMLVRVRTGVAEATVPVDTMVLAITLHDITNNGDWRVADAQPQR
nr:hypothetical protein [Kibdelosporangium sp. MJ126-NF4]